MTVQLSESHEQFAQNYIIDFNATRAAIRAGYSPRSAHVTGFRMLNDAKVTERIQELKQELGVRVEITQDRVVEEYAKIAFANLEDITEWIGGSLRVKNTENISDSAHAAISEITIADTAFGTTTKVKLHDKKGALDSIAKHLGMLTDRLDINANVKTENTFYIEYVKCDAPKNTSDTPVPDITETP